MAEYVDTCPLCPWLTASKPPAFAVLLTRTHTVTLSLSLIKMNTQIHVDNSIQWGLFHDKRITI